MSVINGDGKLFRGVAMRLVEAAIIGAVVLYGTMMTTGVEVKFLKDAVMKMESKLESVCEKVIVNTQVNASQDQILREIREDQKRRNRMDR